MQTALTWASKFPFTPRAALDYSMLNSHMECPRLFLYKYLLNRGFRARNYAIDFGVAYHKFREVLEIAFKKTDNADVSYAMAEAAAIKSFGDNPPSDDPKAYLTDTRLRATCQEAFRGWLQEREQGLLIVHQTETPFELKLPFGLSYSGRTDQLIEWHDKLWIRDFKHTTMMGRTYPQQFEPNHQFTGYSWAASQLSGEQVRGVIVQTAYNTKTQGPDIKQFLSTRTAAHFEQWLASIEKEAADMQRNVDAWDKQGFLAFPMRTNSCTIYAGCPFREACNGGSGRMIDGWLEHNTVERVWDPTKNEKETA